MRVFKYMGFNPSEEEFNKVVQTVDTDGSGEIDRDEFVMAMKLFFEMRREECRDVFDLFVDSESGSMNVKDCFDAVKDLGWFPTEQAVAENVAIVDKDGSGELDFDEFCYLMQRLRKTEGFTRAEIADFE